MDRRRRAARTVALMSLFSMTDTRENVSVASFDGDGSDLISLIVGIDPVQAGSGDPSPDNVRPISGWTGAKVTRTGKNLNPYEGVNFTTDTHPAGFWLNAGDYVFSLDTGGPFGVGNTFYIQLKDGDGNVITDGNISGAGWTLNSTRKYYYGFGNSYTSAPFTLLTDCFFCFGFNTAKPTANGVQLELGSTATSYEPYQGETYSITFPPEAGTVYGGTLDVATGKLTVDRAKIVYNGSETWYPYGTQGYYISRNDMAKATQYKGLLKSDILPTYESNYGEDFKAAKYGIAGWGKLSSLNENYIYVKCGEVSATDKTVIKAWLQENPLTVTYELATPIVYDLTPTQVTTLIGTNNIWADTGDIKYIEYNI